MDNTLRKIKEGDTDAFRVIIERYQYAIRTFIASYGISSGDVDDIAQETFIHVYENIDDFEPGTNMTSWLYTITKYKCLAFFEKTRRTKSNRYNILSATLSLPAKTREDNEEREDYIKKLRECLAGLDEVSLKVITGRYSGVSLNDMAERMNKTLGAVKMMLLRIRMSLRKCVESKT